MPNELIFILGFLVFIVAMLSIDLGLFAKADRPVSLTRAGIMSAVWIALAVSFYLLLLRYGDLLHHVNSFAALQKVNTENFHDLNLNPNDFAGGLELYRQNLGLEFITGYTVEYALSVDNIFIMVLIFTAFAVDPKYYHKVLLWGIIGAVIMRFTFIFVGSALIIKFHWILYLFGAFLVYTGINMFVTRNKETEIDPDNHPVVKFASKYFAVHPKFERGKFFVKVDGKSLITPLLLVLMIIEVTDLVFAVDSIPAVFSITKDPYIVFFSNIFAILGLRSMFFLLVNIIDKFHYLKVGLAALLTFIGLKMLAGAYAEQIGLTTTISLFIILGILVVSIGASLVFPKKEALDKKTTLADIEKLVDNLAIQINVPAYLLPTYQGFSEGTHVEVDKKGLLYYFATERGKENFRYLAADVDDLLYKIFDGATLMMSSKIELSKRIKGQDSRRIIFIEQENLLGTLNEEWRLRKILDHKQILVKYPFDDYASERATYYKSLVDSGENKGNEWILACEKYPLPNNSTNT